MPYTAIEKIVIGDVTTETLDGTGNFDILMRSVKAHVKNEYDNGRIKGPEYSQVYLASLQAALDKAMAFTMEIDKSWLEAEILRLQAEKLEIEKTKATAEVALLGSQKALVDQQVLNAVIEGTVLTAQECKLKAEFDVLVLQKEKVIAETALLNQKKSTELAQTDASSVDPNSVLGRQVSLYGAQIDGFTRDAEQKVAKLMLDTWNVRRTTDDTTSANTDNKLTDFDIGAVVAKLKAGIGT